MIKEQYRRREPNIPVLWWSGSELSARMLIEECVREFGSRSVLSPGGKRNRGGRLLPHFLLRLPRRLHRHGPASWSPRLDGGRSL